MALIARDLMVGNPRLAEMGFREEAEGHNALAGGFQGQRQWTDHFPNGDFLEAILCTSFDWNGIRQPYIVATENDALNGASMLFGHLLTGTAQLFSDVRTYWSPEAVKRVTGHDLTGIGGGRHHPPDQLRPLGAGLDRRADARRRSRPEAVLGDHAGGGRQVPGRDAVVRRAVSEYFPRRRLVDGLHDARRDAGDDVPHQPGEGARARCCRSPRVDTVDLPEAVHRTLDERTNPTWPTTWFVPNLTGQGAVHRRLPGDEPLGREPRRDLPTATSAAT